MSTATQEYINGMRPGPLTREIPECMRDKYTLIQGVMDIIVFVILAISQVIQSVYRTIVGAPTKDLRDSVAVVTGGGGGLGSLIALRLARLGCVVVLWDINKQALEDTVKLVKGVGGKCYGYVVDLSNKEDIYRVATKVKQEVGKVSILVNNAGVVSGQYLLDTPDHLIQRTFDVNILAHFWTAKAFLPSMIEESKGHIVTIASMAGHVGVAKLVDYCSSKAAACGFDEALKSELEVKGVKGVYTSLICPYFIRSTGMFEDVNSRFIPQLNSNDVAARVVRALRTNEDIALMPGFFRILLPFKWLVPYSVTSLLIRVMVRDAMPSAGVALPGGTGGVGAPGVGAPGAATHKSVPATVTLSPPARLDRHV